MKDKRVNDEDPGPVVSDGILDVKKFLAGERDCTIVPVKVLHEGPEAIVVDTGNSVEVIDKDDGHRFDVTDFVIRYESGELESQEELVEGFQKLIDSGAVWQFQGSYGRMAVDLIEAGVCQVVEG